MMSRIVEITMIRMREIEPKLLELIKKRLQR
jgi:hypothetical protein